MIGFKPCRGKCPLEDIDFMKKYKLIISYLDNIYFINSFAIRENKYYAYFKNVTDICLATNVR